MSEHYNSVKHFMTVFGQEVLTEFKLPSPKVGKLRYDLIKEERDELEVAMFNNDRIEVADALADLLYVIYGAYHAMGLTFCEVSSDLGEVISPKRDIDIADAKLILRELDVNLHKLDAAYITGSEHDITDSLDNMLFYIYQFSINIGLDIYACFSEVHNSNMSKVCTDEQFAVHSMNVRYHDEGKADYRDAWIDEVEGLFLIKRSYDDKVLKGLGYFEPSLAQFL